MGAEHGLLHTGSRHSGAAQLSQPPGTLPGFKHGRSRKGLPGCGGEKGPPTTLPSSRVGPAGGHRRSRCGSTLQITATKCPRLCNTVTAVTEGEALQELWVGVVGRQSRLLQVEINRCSRPGALLRKAGGRAGLGRKGPGCGKAGRRVGWGIGVPSEEARCVSTPLGLHIPVSRVSCV